MTPKQKLEWIVRSARGDNLERAELAFGRMSDNQLDEPYGHSGKTRRQILLEYRRERSEYEAAAKLIDNL